jgi:parvulin-like peptidyl-prolyl isomerase
LSKLLLAIVVWSAGTISTAWAQAGVIAQAGSLPPVQVDEARAAIFMSAPDKQAEAWSSKATVRQIAEERLTLKQWDATRGGMTFTPEEQIYIDYQQAVNRLKAGLDVAERRRLAEIYATPELLKARAKEIYLANPVAYETPERVSATVIVIDTTKRNWKDAQAHVAKIQLALRAKGADFVAVARRYTDDPLASAGKRDVTVTVADAQVDIPVRNQLFTFMKPGEISKPIATTVGLMIMKLNEKFAKTPRPFDEVEAQIVAKLMDEQSKAARRAVMASLALPAITYSPEYAPETPGLDHSALVLKVVEQAARDGKSPEETNRLIMQAIEDAKARP